MEKVLKIGVAWFVVIVAEIILAFVYPAFTGLTDVSATALQATSNMSNYPGMLAGIQTGPLWVWFIPPGIGIAATVAFLREEE